MAFEVQRQYIQNPEKFDGAQRDIYTPEEGTAETYMSSDKDDEEAAHVADVTKLPFI